MNKKTIVYIVAIGFLFLCLSGNVYAAGSIFVKCPPSWKTVEVKKEKWKGYKKRGCKMAKGKKGKLGTASKPSWDNSRRVSPQDLSIIKVPDKSKPGDKIKNTMENKKLRKRIDRAAPLITKPLSGSSSKPGGEIKNKNPEKNTRPTETITLNFSKIKTDNVVPKIKGMALRPGLNPVHSSQGLQLAIKYTNLDARYVVLDQNGRSVPYRTYPTNTLFTASSGRKGPVCKVCVEDAEAGTGQWWEVPCSILDDVEREGGEKEFRLKE